MSTTSLMIFLKLLEKKNLVKFRQMYAMKMCRLHQAQIGPFKETIFQHAVVDLMNYVQEVQQ
jgi:hypothetical protein